MKKYNKNKTPRFDRYRTNTLDLEFTTTNSLKLVGTNFEKNTTNLSHSHTIYGVFQLKNEIQKH